MTFAFWNLQNLFDATQSAIAADLEFTPANGWTEAAVSRKIANLAQIIRLMGDGRGPDLLGLCEIENLRLANRLVRAIGRDDYAVAHHTSPDLRGIDCSLIYSRDHFELIPDDPPRGHVVNLRFRTRDIFEAPLRVKANGAELLVCVNHWPSRSRGTLQSEPFRIALAATLGRILDDRLKLSREELLALPDSPESRRRILDRWNRNILILGDFNDDVFDRSVLGELKAGNSQDQLEQLPLPRSRNLPRDFEAYLRRQAFFYNYLWRECGREGVGSIYYANPGAARTKQVFDQVMASRGLFYGERGLRVAPESVEIFAPREMWTNSRLTEARAAEEPHLVRPRRFGVKKARGRFVIEGGFSDHFPVVGRLEA